MSAPTPETVSFEDNHGRDIAIGSYVWHDEHEAVHEVRDLDGDTGCVIDENDEDWIADRLEVLVPHPPTNPEWFYAPGSERWIAPVGDGSISVVLYNDELRSLDAARAALAAGGA